MIQLIATKCARIAGSKCRRLALARPAKANNSTNLRVLIFCFLLATIAPAPASAVIRYEVSLAHPEQHLFHVSMDVPGVEGELKVQIPAWNALYEIRDFSSHVQQVEAYANGQRIEITKLDKLTWQVHAGGAITIRYATFWDDSGPFGTQLNPDHAFINPAMILLYVEDRRTESSELRLADIPGGWHVASSALAPGADGALLKAESYDALADAPIEVSKFSEFDLPDLSPKVHVVIHGDGWNKHEVETALRKICVYEIHLMEGAPYPRYTFIFHLGKGAAGGAGGMEHANSTAISLQSATFLPNISAHEFFHLWNVKRIRPVSLEPIDYTREMYTRSLWFAEGVTNTYASFALVRTGLWNKQDFYQDLSLQISEVEARPAEQWQSAEQSSLDAWLEKYYLYNSPQNSVSYYTKGQILGVLLDIVIRDRTNNQRSLDDVVRALNSDFAKNGKFYRDGLDLRLTAEKVTGSSLDDFFSKYVAGAQPLPYAEVLSRAGIELRAQQSIRATLGFYVDRDKTGAWLVRSLDPNGNASRAGLHPGDEIVHWNNGDVPRRPERWLSQQHPGDLLLLHVRRPEKEEDLRITLGEVRETFYQVSEIPHADDRARHIRDGLLRGDTDPVTAGNH